MAYVSSAGEDPVWPSLPYPRLSLTRALRRSPRMSTYPLISSDSHIIEPPDLWTQRINRAFTT